MPSEPLIVRDNSFFTLRDAQMALLENIGDV
jgi:hypothetical protein